MNDNRQFLKTVNSFLSHEGLQCSQINSLDQDIVILQDKSFSKEFSNFFDTAVKDIDVKVTQVSHVNENSDSIDIALNKYVNHPSTFKIRKYFNKPTECNFWEVTPTDIKKEIKSSDSSKRSTFKNITPKSLNMAVIVRYMG